MWILNFFEFFLSFQFNNLCCATNSYSHWWIESETSCVHLRWSVLSGAVRAKSLAWMTNTKHNFTKYVYSRLKTELKSNTEMLTMQFVSVSFFEGHLLSPVSLHTHVWGERTPTSEGALIVCACSESSHNSITVHIATKLVCVNLACHNGMCVLFSVVFLSCYVYHFCFDKPIWCCWLLGRQVCELFRKKKKRKKTSMGLNVWSWQSVNVIVMIYVKTDMPFSY